MMESSGYSLSDIRAATQDENEGFGGSGGGWFWIVVLFLFMFGFGGNGMWGNNSTNNALTRGELAQDMNFQSVENGVRGIQQGLCDGFYSQNTTMLNGLSSLQRDLCTGFNAVSQGISDNRFASQQCCCETNRNIDAVRSENYRNTCDIINANTMQELRDRLETKNTELQTANFQLSQQAQNAYLVNQIAPRSIPAYLTCSPYQAANYPYGLNNGCSCA
jgi:hypothetical protein